MTDIPFAVLMRLIWIDAVLCSNRQMNRADICSAFAISIPQASSDLRVFQFAFPGRLAYDARAKVYRAVPGSLPVYPTESRFAVHRAASAVGAVMMMAANA